MSEPSINSVRPQSHHIKREALQAAFKTGAKEAVKTIGENAGGTVVDILLGPGGRAVYDALVGAGRVLSAGVSKYQSVMVSENANLADPRILACKAEVVPAFASAA